MFVGFTLPPFHVPFRGKALWVATKKQQLQISVRASGAAILSSV